MNRQLRRQAASVALLAILSACAGTGFVYAETPGMGKSFALNVIACLVQQKGIVEKAEPSNAAMTELRPFASCQLNDQLAEGTVIRTGQSSFAKIQWSEGRSKDLATNIFPKSLIRISAQHRTVYLSSGAIAFKKDPAASEYLVETKRLQARIRGTTIRLQCTPTEDRLIVLETVTKGVEVKNKLDGSGITLTPGVEFVVRGSITDYGAIPPAVYEQNKSMKLPAELKSSETKEIAEQNPLNDLRLDEKKGEVLFKNKLSETRLYVADGKAILEDPSIVGGNGFEALESLPRIREVANKLPRKDDMLGKLASAFNGGKPDKIISDNVQVKQVPNKTSYYVGPNVGADKSIKLPSIAYTPDFMPSGVVPNTVSMDRSFISQTNLSLGKVNVQAPTMIRPASPPPSSDPLADPIADQLGQAQITSKLQGNLTQFQAVQNANSSRAGSGSNSISVINVIQPAVQVASPVTPFSPVAPIAPITPHFSPLQAPGRNNADITPFQAHNQSLGGAQFFNGSLAQQLLNNNNNGHN